MFCLQIALINAFFFSETRSNLRTAAIFAGIWVFELSFGQVNLWQDGAVNYLWSAVFMLGFLYPFADRFLNGKDFTDKKLAKAGFLVYALFTGSYSETASSAAIFVACLLLLLDVFCNHRKISKYGISCIVLAVAGYVSIYFAPAQFVNKSASLSPFVLAKNIANATLIYEKFGALIVTLVVLLVICAVEKVCIKRILLSLSFAAGSLAANYIMIFARYYSERSAVGAFVLLLAAIGVLIPPVLERKSWKIGLVSAMIVLVLSSVSPLLLGMLDIYITHLDIQMNEQIIHNTIAEGNLDIALPVIESGSQYGSLYKTVYLTEDSSHWINVNMAKYYGVNSLTGYTAIP